MAAQSSPLSLNLLHSNYSRPSSSPIRASSSSAAAAGAAPAVQPLTVPALEEAFGRKGIKFSESRGVTNVELTVRNGSSARIRTSDAVIESYRPKVYWKDDGCREVLYTLPVTDGSLKGGIGLILDESPAPAAATGWVVRDVDNDSFDVVQVELERVESGGGPLEVSYVVTLYPLSLATAVVVRNASDRPVQLRSAILSHVKFGTKYGSAVKGLTGCSYRTHPPMPSSFGIMTPAEAMLPDEPGWFSFLSGNDGSDDSSWAVEDDMYTILRGKMSRVYSAPPEERAKGRYRTPPSNYTTVDQGCGLGFRVTRIGFEDIYLGSPGSTFRKFGPSYFICTGPASVLVPVEIGPGEEWRAAQVIEHDNL